jgi:AbrB family looped-hinge helix DNA binding protein
MRITSKGQVTIPIDIREKLGLLPDSEVVFEVERDSVRIRKALPRDYFRRDALPWEASFLVAKCFARYRRKADARRSPLPDFFIGAHAAVAGMTLLTRDARRYRTYFPKLKIVAP